MNTTNHYYLFGIHQSNRDFSLAENWGKNQFNSSFPTALACYMQTKNIKPVYLTLNKNLNVEHKKIMANEAFKIEPLSEFCYFSFESPFEPFQSFLSEEQPRIDLVVKKKLCLEQYIDKKGLEVKLTALPDESTFDLSEEEYGSELVIRPDTILYLALQLAENFKNEKDFFKNIFNKYQCITYWNHNDKMIFHLSDMIVDINSILLHKLNNQTPLLMQPIWKTKGKSAVLDDNCLDLFFWSDYALTRLFVDKINTEKTNKKISRHARTLIWLVKMLTEFTFSGKINHKKIFDEITYNSQTDKAFSVNGKTTNFYMKSPELLQPRIKKHDIKNIILNGAEEFLSPERRFDAVVKHAGDLFS